MGGDDFAKLGRFGAAILEGAGCLLWIIGALLLACLALAGAVAYLLLR